MAVSQTEGQERRAKRWQGKPKPGAEALRQQRTQTPGPKPSPQVASTPATQKPSLLRRAAGGAGKVAKFMARASVAPAILAYTSQKSDEAKQRMAQTGEKPTSYSDNVGRVVKASLTEGAKFFQDPAKVGPVDFGNVSKAWPDKAPQPVNSLREPTSRGTTVDQTGNAILEPANPTNIRFTPGQGVTYSDTGSGDNFNNIQLRGASGASIQGRGAFMSNAGPGSRGMSPEQWGAMSNADKIKANVASYDRQTASLRSLREARQGGTPEVEGPFTLSRTKPGEGFKRPAAAAPEQPDFYKGLEGISRGRAAKIAMQREKNWMQNQLGQESLRQRTQEGELDRQNKLATSKAGKTGAPGLRDQLAISQFQRGISKDKKTEERALRSEQDALFDKLTSDDPGRADSAVRSLSAQLETDPTGAAATTTMDFLTDWASKSENKEFNSLWDGWWKERTKRGGQGRLNLDDLASFELEYPGWLERNLLGDAEVQLRTGKSNVAIDLTGPGGQLMQQAIRIAKQRAGQQ